jgi:hypothetical protein
MWIKRSNIRCDVAIKPSELDRHTGTPRSFDPEEHVRGYAATLVHNRGISGPKPRKTRIDAQRPVIRNIIVQDFRLGQL